MRAILENPRYTGYAFFGRWTAIASGVDPGALVEVINEAQAERAAARAELEEQPAPNVLTAAEVHAMIDSLSDVGAALGEAKPDSLANLYEAVDLQVRYEPGRAGGRRRHQAGTTGE